MEFYIMKLEQGKDNLALKHLIKKSGGDVDKLRSLFRERFNFEATIVTRTDPDFWLFGARGRVIKIK